MNKFRKMIPYLLINVAIFYLLPLLGNSTGSFLIILLVIIPSSCFITSFVYGYNYGWNMILPIVIGIIFIPAIFIYFNSSAWVYVVGYSVISAAGVFIGKTNKKK